MSKIIMILIGLSSAFVLASPSMAQTESNVPTTRIGTGQPTSAEELTKRYPALQSNFGLSDAQFAVRLPTIEIFMGGFPTLQADLGLNDADFAVLLPKIMNEQTASGAVGGMTFRPRPQLPFGMTGAERRGAVITPWQQLPQARTAIGYAWNDLKDAVKDPNTPEDVIKAKLDSYHAARSAALANARQAKEELRTFVTLRQEAVLVSYGFLD